MLLKPTWRHRHANVKCMQELLLILHLLSHKSKIDRRSTSGKLCFRTVECFALHTSMLGRDVQVNTRAYRLLTTNVGIHYSHHAAAVAWDKTAQWRIARAFSTPTPKQQYPLESFARTARGARLDERLCRGTAIPR